MTSLSSLNRKISIDNMQKIIEMSDNYDRTEIAREMKVSKQIIYKYQKFLRLI